MGSSAPCSPVGDALRCPKCGKTLTYQHSQGDGDQASHFYRCPKHGRLVLPAERHRSRGRSGRFSRAALILGMREQQGQFDTSGTWWFYFGGFSNETPDQG